MKCSNAVRQVPRRLGVESKPCQRCPETCVRRPTEPASCWKARRYCSPLCARRSRIVEHSATKVCPSCGETFARRVGAESMSQFVKRRTCSKLCANRATGAARRLVGDEAKTCPQCSVEFHRQVGVETAAQFAARRHCSRSCGNRGAGMARREAPAVEVPEVKTCTACGEDYRRPANVSPKPWLRRRFCGTVCAGSERRTDGPKVKAPAQAPVRPSGPQTVWRPAAWGGPIVVAPPADALAAAR